NPGSIASNQGNRTVEKPINSKPLDEGSGNSSGNSTVIANNRNNSSIFNDENNNSAINSNPGSIASNQGNRTVEKPINSKPLDEGFGNSNGNSTAIADRGNTNSGSISDKDNQGSPGLSNPGSIGNNTENRTVSKPAPNSSQESIKSGDKCNSNIRNCDLPKARSYIKRNFDGKERTVRITVTYNQNGRVTNVQINPSTGNSNYDRMIRRDARRLRFPKGKSGTLRFNFNIVKPGTQKQREAVERQRDNERRRREAEETRRREEEARKEKEKENQPQPTPTSATPAKPKN
ncbi:MAG: energy transducer TonB, partial [Cyanobacteria bacterium P01_D01_bin.50]